MRAVAVAVAVAAVAACGSDGEPRFDAACAPNAAMEEVTCTIRNNGTKAGRACFTARVQPEAGMPLVARRLCTAVLEPGRAIEAKPQFEQMERARRDKTLPDRCVRLGRWTCKVDVVETPQQMSGQGGEP